MKYKHVVFTQGFRNEKSKYQGPPSEAVDAAWEDLYGKDSYIELKPGACPLTLELAEFGVSRIDKASADQLINRTSEIPDDRGYYMTALDVFHQLHCLNNVRKAVWPEYYGTWGNSSASEIAETQDHLSTYMSATKRLHYRCRFLIE